MFLCIYMCFCKIIVKNTRFQRKKCMHALNFLCYAHCTMKSLSIYNQNLNIKSIIYYNLLQVHKSGLRCMKQTQYCH